MELSIVAFVLRIMLAYPILASYKKIESLRLNSVDSILLENEYNIE